VSEGKERRAESVDFLVFLIFVHFYFIFNFMKYAKGKEYRSNGGKEERGWREEEK
jgi:hypothetical protein